jgi:hypothetical protein
MTSEKSNESTCFACENGNSYESICDECRDISNVKIINYYKYTFTIQFTTGHNKTITISCGGDHNDIYRFSPTSEDWDEWKSAGNLCIVSCKSNQKASDE